MDNRGRGRGKPGRRRVAGPRGVAESSAVYELLGVPDRVNRVAAVLGNNLTAEVLGVSNSQPSRWRSGADRISGENMTKLVELDYLITRLLQRMTPRVVNLWLHGQNPHIGGRPIDVLRRRGIAAVVPAVEAEETGAYA